MQIHCSTRKITYFEIKKGRGNSSSPFLLRYPQHITYLTSNFAIRVICVRFRIKVL
jgi:hypothetical protein